MSEATHDLNRLPDKPGLGECRFRETIETAGGGAKARSSARNAAAQIQITTVPFAMNTGAHRIQELPLGRPTPGVIELCFGVHYPI